MISIICVFFILNLRRAQRPDIKSANNNLPRSSGQAKLAQITQSPGELPKRQNQLQIGLCIVSSIHG